MRTVGTKGMGSSGRWPWLKRASAGGAGGQGCHRWLSIRPKWLQGVESNQVFQNFPDVSAPRMQGNNNCARILKPTTCGWNIERMSRKRKDPCPSSAAHEPTKIKSIAIELRALQYIGLSCQPRCPAEISPHPWSMAKTCARETHTFTNTEPAEVDWDYLVH